MPHPLSTLGIVHTLISVIPIAAALHGFVRFGRIEPSSRSGQLYLASLALSVVTSFGLSSTGGFNPGHAIGILALLAAFSAMVIPRLSFLGRSRPYLATFGPSFSFFLLLVPGITETITRLPAGRPFASSPADPLVATLLAAWLTLFVLGFALQSLAIRAGSTTGRSA
jgi:hypothetical protein